VRRNGAELEEAAVLLARFVPGPGRVGRIVLHPRLTIVPLRRDDFDGLGASFTTDVPVLVARAAEVRAVADVDSRKASLDDAIAQLDDARAHHAAATAAVTEADARLREARAALDRVAEQRARADDAVAAARERLATPAGASDAGALRAQIDVVLRSVAEAATERRKAVGDAQDALDAARREFALAQRRLAVAIDRGEPGTDTRAPSAARAAEVVDRLRACRAALDDEDVATPTALLRRVAQSSPAPVVVLVEPFDPAPDGIVEALAAAASTTKPIVYVTDDERVLDAARALDPDAGALRTPLVTETAVPALARTDGNLL